MAGALRGAASGGTPWVLDPVAAGGLEWRTSIAQALLDQHPPAIIRGNASEIIAIAGQGKGGRGVESVDPVDEAVDVARKLASDRGTVVAVSGEVDHLTDGTRLVRVANGHPWLTQVTGAGCALGALMAAFTAVTADPLVAATSATATLTVAAERAAEHSAGPGSFAVSLIDQLAALSSDDLAAAVRLS
jgi:hydroxyethylthiazole kinase